MSKKLGDQIVKVVNPEGTVLEMTLTNARDVTRNMKGFRFYRAEDEPKEQKAVVGERRVIEDAVEPGTEGDPSPEDIEAVQVAVSADEEDKPRSRGRS